MFPTDYDNIDIDNIAHFLKWCYLGCKCYDNGDDDDQKFLFQFGQYEQYE